MTTSPLNDLFTKLQKLNQLSGASMAKIDKAIDQELSSLGVVPTAGEAAFAKLTNRSPTDVAFLRVSSAADEKELAAIPKEKMTMLRVLVGEDKTAILTRWRATQKFVAAQELKAKRGY